MKNKFMGICIGLEKAFDCAQEINIYNQGECSTYGCGEPVFNTVLNGFKEMIDGAHEMPAFGVSINNLTMEARSEGLWVEFAFDKTYESNGMPYEKLLIEVRQGYQGFNINRYNSQYGYDGRCFYYDLVNKNMDNFYNILINI